MADAELLVDTERIDPDAVDLQQLLTGLLNHPLVMLYRYSDDGPPPMLKPLEFPDTPFANGTRVYEGWVVLEQREPVRGAWTVTYPTDGGFAVSGMIGNAPDVAAADTRTDVYKHLGDDAARDRRRMDALATQVAAQGLGADIYLTERPYLHEPTTRIGRGITVCRPADAIALLGLYLRAQGQFYVADKFRFNRGLFYWVGTRELLPEAWRWFTACVRHSQGVGDDELLLLAGSLLQRVDRALEERDAVQIALNQPQNNDLQDDALTHLDNILVFLMGAVDVAARVAHRVLGLPAESEFNAGWQRTRPGGWLDQVASARPQLAAVVAPGTDGEHTLTILRLLRNSVHGAALDGVAYHESGSPLQSLVGLPKGQEQRLLASMDALGGREHWGARPLLPGRTHVDPGILADRLFEHVPPLLNRLIANTPVESLLHVNLSPQDLVPPDGGSSTDPFAQWIRQSIRWQLGL